ncbi:MAG: PspC domain-containing protein [Anaerolineaceae bacterium]|nr:PspC domain-containing protein [Anaerolineaceae bacterium]
MNERRLYRSQNDQMIAGVCGGLGEYFQVDATLIRVFFAIAVLVFGHGLLVYLLLLILMPMEPNVVKTQTSAQPANESVES